jgi:conjugative transfer region protein TrbK
VFGACVIQLRGENDQTEAPVPATRDDDPLAEKLARCRNVTYEQKDALAECRKVWAEKRRQFLGEKNIAPSHSDSAASDGSPASGSDGNDRFQSYPFAPKKD